MQVVAHNIQAQFANRNLGVVTTNQSKSMEKLSSGYRVNRAADDAAGLAVSEKMRWQIRGLDKGSTNCADGASLVQVAEGALNEVHDMLHRMKELAVQGGNDTNTDTDREHIRNEMEQLAGEINRISDSTTFNTRYLFKGSEKPIINNDTGQPVSLQNIPISDFTISDVSLTGDPFNASTNGQRLNLVASLGGNYSISGTSWPLVYGSGSTSHSNFRYSYVNDGGNTVRVEKKLENMPITNVTIDRNTNTYSRTFRYEPEAGIKFDITQQITIGENDGEKQLYTVSYGVTNKGTKTAYFELMHNEDTAYNNNDGGEQYYMNGTKLDHYGMYTRKTDYVNSGNSNVHGWQASMTDFSIYNTEVGRLPFTEKVKVEENVGLQTIVFGQYPETFDWNKMDSFNCGISGETGATDKTFSIIWGKELEPNKGLGNMTFRQGIYAATSDPNLTGVPMSPANTMTMHLDKMDLWIQSGATMLNGFFITVDEMNRKTLGIDPLEVASYEKASATNARIDKAADKISTMRARLGSQQNRLEHSIAIDDNSSENTSAAESRIRDTDMAKEMVSLAAANIIAKAGQSVLTQANQTPQGVLSLLQ